MELEDTLSNCWEESYPTKHIDYILMVTIFIESISNQNYDEHPIWQNILDIERCEREKDGFVTVFPFHSFLFGIINIEICFLVQTEKDSAKVFKTFF